MLPPCQSCRWLGRFSPASVFSCSTSQGSPCKTYLFCPSGLLLSFQTLFCVCGLIQKHLETDSVWSLHIFWSLQEPGYAGTRKGSMPPPSREWQFSAISTVVMWQGLTLLHGKHHETPLLHDNQSTVFKYCFSNTMNPASPGLCKAVRHCKAL